MNLPSEIKTIDDQKEITTTIKKSKFITQVFYIESESEFKTYLDQAKKKHYTASHHCYAFKLANGIVRYSDAGEPNGSAGIRILNAIEHFSLANQLVIVSRIFGGIKLGVGPLGKAYYESAFNILSKSIINNKQLLQRVKFISTIEQSSIISKLISQFNSIVLKSDYKETLSIECLVKSNKINKLQNKLSESTKNKASLEIQDELVYR